MSHQIFRKRWQLGWWCQLKSNKKPPMGYRFIPWPLTLDDLEPFYRTQDCSIKYVEYGERQCWAQWRSDIKPPIDLRLALGLQTLTLDDLELSQFKVTKLHIKYFENSDIRWWCQWNCIGLHRMYFLFSMRWSVKRSERATKSVLIEVRKPSQMKLNALKFTKITSFTELHTEVCFRERRPISQKMPYCHDVVN